MIRISITAAAFEAIADSLPIGTIAAKPQHSDQGKVFIWIGRQWRDQLDRIRRPGEDLSDVIIRIAGTPAEVDPIDELVRIVGEAEPRKPAAPKRGSDRRPIARRRR